MNIGRTERFKRAYKKLPSSDKERVRKAIAQLLEDFRYPALQVKRIRGTASIWEARVSLGCRVTFELDGNTILLRTISEHNATLKNP